MGSLIPFCPGTIPSATSYFFKCRVLGVFPLNPIPCRMLGEAGSQVEKSEGCGNCDLHSSTFRTLAGGRGRSSLCKHLSLPSSQQHLSHHSFGLSPPYSFRPHSQAYLFLPTFFASYLCLSIPFSIKKKKKTQQNQSTERLDLQMSGQETGNKGNQNRRRSRYNYCN